MCLAVHRRDLELKIVRFPSIPARHGTSYDAVSLQQDGLVDHSAGDVVDAIVLFQLVPVRLLHDPEDLHPSDAVLHAYADPGVGPVDVIDKEGLAMRNHCKTASLQA